MKTPGRTDGDYPETPRPLPLRAGTVRLPLSAHDLARYDAIIDTRSPAEWAHDHLPGAISCPVLNDAERVTVGTLYKQSSSFEAKKVGAALVARNIATHLDTIFRDKPKNWRPLIYCWRGGSRSGAMTHILRQVGWDAVQLEGGYKQWRAQVVRDLAVLPAPFRFVAICGRTGSGKSRLIEALGQAGHQALDLEALAAHKGSVLGDLPGAPQPSQKAFETSIWSALVAFDPARPVYVEAESKKIGLLRVPDTLIAAMWEGDCVELVTDRSLRIPLLCDEYAHLIADPVHLAAKLSCLKRLHPGERIEQWMSHVQAARWETLVAELLTDHYDPLYTRSMFRNYRHAEKAVPIPLHSIDAKGFADAARRTAAAHDTKRDS